jgi:tetratricopeptide (TPR) repeat protein
VPIDTKPLNTQPPVLAYARLLVESQRLIDAGKGDSDEAEALADRMDAPWHALTALEQARMKGLSADLNALAEGGPKRVNMTKEQLEAWQKAIKEVNARAETGDVDEALNFLRRPVPSTLPRQVIPFLQARYWEKLGDLETALVFMKEADRLDPEQALSVLVLLQQLGKVDELPHYANRVIASAASPPLELYIAGAALLDPRLRTGEADSKSMVQRAVAALRRAQKGYLGLAPEERSQSPEAETYIAQALGLGLELLGDFQAAIAVYSEAIDRNPRQGELFVARGLALYETDPPRALADFACAARLGVASLLPYLLLARHALQTGSAAEALRLAVVAERQQGPASARAEVYETIGIALAELGQPQAHVLENFDTALALDPNNERIQENRAIAAALPRSSRGGRTGRPRLRPAPPMTPERSQRARRDQINSSMEVLSEQRISRVSNELVGV